MAVAACGGGGGGGGGAPAPTGANLSGSVQKGPMVNGSLRAMALDDWLGGGETCRSKQGII